MQIKWTNSLPCKPYIITQQQHTDKLYSASIPSGTTKQTIGKDLQTLGTLGACKGTTRKGSLRGLTLDGVQGPNS